jgi:predicted ATPase
MDNFVVITGCSGGGKSTLLRELQQRGHRTIDEPGRRVVAHQLSIAGNALPWIDLAAFAREAMKLAINDRETVSAEPGWVFFDRSLIDAQSALTMATKDDSAIEALRHKARYHRRVFAVEPWPEIYVQDQERRHGLTEAIEEYNRLARLYPKLGYDWIVVPKASVAVRADFILRTLHA